MKIKTKFEVGQEVFFVIYTYNKVYKQCTECEDGKIETKKGSILPCPLCLGQGEYIEETEEMSVASSQIESLSISHSNKFGQIIGEPDIDYWINNKSIDPHNSPKRYDECYLFATREEAEEKLKNLMEEKSVSER